MRVTLKMLEENYNMPSILAHSCWRGVDANISYRKWLERKITDRVEAWLKEINQKYLNNKLEVVRDDYNSVIAYHDSEEVFSFVISYSRRYCYKKQKTRKLLKLLASALQNKQ